MQTVMNQTACMLYTEPNELKVTGNLS